MTKRSEILLFTTKCFLSLQIKCMSDHSDILTGCPTQGYSATLIAADGHQAEHWSYYLLEPFYHFYCPSTALQPFLQGTWLEPLWLWEVLGHSRYSANRANLSSQKEEQENTL